MKFLSRIFFIMILFPYISYGVQAFLSWDSKNAACKLLFHGKEYRCALGRSGIVTDKKEGDGGTPEGSFSIRKIFYRPDRINIAELKTTIPLVALSQNDGWSDDINSPEYNQFVKLPYEYNHEKLWRDDHVYDIIAVLGYNDDPVIKGNGSAIFLHIARENYLPTAGCIALEKNDLLYFISQFKNDDKITIQKTKNDSPQSE